MSKILVYTRWVKQKVKCKVNDKEEILDIIEVIDDEIETEDYEKV